MNRSVLMMTVSILGILVALMSLEVTSIISANAQRSITPGERFCFEAGPGGIDDARCFNGPANCEKAQDEFIANGGTVFSSCTHSFKPVKP